MTRRFVLAAMGILVAAAAGCQTLNFSTPTATPSYTPVSQLTTGATAANPTTTTPSGTTPATPASPAAPASPASPAAQ